MTSMYYRKSRFEKSYVQKYGKVILAIYHAISYIVVFYNQIQQMIDQDS